MRNLGAAILAAWLVLSSPLGAEEAKKEDPIQRLRNELEAQARRAGQQDAVRDSGGSARAEAPAAGWSKDVVARAKAQDEERRRREKEAEKVEKELAKRAEEARKRTEKLEREELKREEEARKAWARGGEGRERAASGYASRERVYVEGAGGGGYTVESGGWTELGGVSRSSSSHSGSAGGYANEGASGGSSIGVRATVIRLED